MADLARHWTLDPDVVYLNHGSFGACPRVVLEVQAELRARMERQLVRFYIRELPGLRAEARRRLAAFVGAPADGLAFVANATTGLNSVLHSLRFAPGDELLVTDQEYNASRNALAVAAERAGATLVVAKVPFPSSGPDEVVDAVLAAVTSRTRLALVDHVTSQTAMVFPIERLVRELEERGVDVLVDGAHAPGMVPLDVGALAPAYYAGNCHKWLLAPKSVGFLWVREDRREAVRPAVISHGANAPVPIERRYRAEFDWMGTLDWTPALSVPAAIDFGAGVVSGGWDEVRSRNHGLAVEGRRLILDALGVPAPCADAMLGSMASIPLPPGAGSGERGGHSALDPDPIHERLLDEFGIEVPVLTCPAHPGRMVRISAQLYNERVHYERLAEALASIC